MLGALTIRAKDALNLGGKMPIELRDDRHAAAGDAACDFDVAGKKMSK